MSAAFTADAHLIFYYVLWPHRLHANSDWRQRLIGAESVAEAAARTFIQINGDAAARERDCLIACVAAADGASAAAASFYKVETWLEEAAAVNVCVVNDAAERFAAEGLDIFKPHAFHVG